MPNNKFSFSREDLFGQNGDETITQSLHPKKSGERISPVGRLQYRGYRSREETEALIKSALKDAGKRLKFREVARAVDRSANPFLRQILDDMFARGEVIKTEDVSPNEQLPRYWYELPPRK